jgi:arabinose-5-phosphate isomerase
VEHILACNGRIAVTGLGKSGLVGRKIAATLASTGTPAFFVHAADAHHGDAGMVTRGDVLIAISNSGETHEVVEFVRVARARNVVVLAMTGATDSTLSSLADECLFCGVDKEADPLDLAPTASTAATMALGDALGVALMVVRGFTATDFLANHPAGRLGVMATGRSGVDAEGDAANPTD